MNLSFTQQEMQWANMIYNATGAWVPKIAREVMGENNFNNHDYQDIVKYCVKLLGDELFQEAYRNLNNAQQFWEIPQEDIDTLAKHFIKMNRFGRGQRFLNTNDLAQLGLKHINSYAVCRNLEAPFDIYNQGHFIDGSDKYVFVKKGNKESIIETTRCPYSETGEDLESEQAKIEPKEGCFDEQGNQIYTLKIKNEYVGLLNRFAIIISLKPPAFHCGCTVSVNGAGNKIYIYALEFKYDKGFDRKIENKLGQWNNVTTVMGFGFNEKELEPRLIEATNYIRKFCDVRCTILVKPNNTFESKVDWLVETPEDSEVDFGAFNQDADNDNSGMEDINQDTDINDFLNNL